MKNFEPFDWKSLDSQPVIGVDEVGRGCLAGPVYAAAVIINPVHEFSQFLDSKSISEKQREKLTVQIKKNHQWSVAFATVEEIECLNILQASLLAMKRAVLKLGLTKGHVLVDGNQKIPNLDCFLKQTTLIKGDLRAAPISAASILAKTTRDRLLTEMAIQWPDYGFEKHKGYSTQFHKQAIRQFGPCAIHRKTFSGVKEWVNLGNQD